MADVLVDTSVWIEFFRNEKGSCGDLLENLLEEDRVVLCGIVEMEISQGLRKKEQQEIQSVFEMIPYIDITREDYIAAGTLWQALRKKGETIPSTDCLIAELCLRHEFSLFSLDTHFDKIKRLKRLR